MKYIAKADTWFDEGTEAIPIIDFVDAYDDWEMTKLNPFSLFRGIRNGEVDEEICTIDEFEAMPA